jgi:hypothetical protein
MAVTRGKSDYLSDFPFGFFAWIKSTLSSRAYPHGHVSPRDDSGMMLLRSTSERRKTQSTKEEENSCFVVS